MFKFELLLFHFRWWCQISIVCKLSCSCSKDCQVILNGIVFFRMEENSEMHLRDASVVERTPLVSVNQISSQSESLFQMIFFCVSLYLDVSLRRPPSSKIVANLSTRFKIFLQHFPKVFHHRLKVCITSPTAPQKLPQNPPSEPSLRIRPQERPSESIITSTPQNHPSEPSIRTTPQNHPSKPRLRTTHRKNSSEPRRTTTPQNHSPTALLSTTPQTHASDPPLKTTHQNHSQNHMFLWRTGPCTIHLKDIVWNMDRLSWDVTENIFRRVPNPNHRRVQRTCGEVRLTAGSVTRLTCMSSPTWTRPLTPADLQPCPGAFMKCVATRERPRTSSGRFFSCSVCVCGASFYSLHGRSSQPDCHRQACDGPSVVRLHAQLPFLLKFHWLSVVWRLHGAVRLAALLLLAFLFYFVLGKRWDYDGFLVYLTGAIGLRAEIFLAPRSGSAAVHSSPRRCHVWLSPAGELVRNEPQR